MAITDKNLRATDFIGAEAAAAVAGVTPGRIRQLLRDCKPAKGRPSVYPFEVYDEDGDVAGIKQGLQLWLASKSWAEKVKRIPATAGPRRGRPRISVEKPEKRARR